MNTTTFLTMDMAIEQYDEVLDMDGTVFVGGIYFHPSHILRELDPIAYNEGLMDYMDACDQEIVGDDDPRMDE